MMGTPEGVAQANDNILRTIQGLGEKLFHVHFHDVRYEDWRDHRELGTGILDFSRIVAALDEVGYTGLIELELEEQEREDALYSSRVYLEGLATEDGPGGKKDYAEAEDTGKLGEPGDSPSQSTPLS